MTIHHYLILVTPTSNAVTSLYRYIHMKHQVNKIAGQCSTSWDLLHLEDVFMKMVAVAFLSTNIYFTVLREQYDGIKGFTLYGMLSPTCILSNIAINCTYIFATSFTSSRQVMSFICLNKEDIHKELASLLRKLTFHNSNWHTVPYCSALHAVYQSRKCVCKFHNQFLIICMTKLMSGKCVWVCVL